MWACWHAYYSCLYITTNLCKYKYIYISMCRVPEMQSDRVYQGHGECRVLCNLTRNGHGYPFNGHEYINNKNVFVYYTQTWPTHSTHKHTTHTVTRRSQLTRLYANLFTFANKIYGRVCFLLFFAVFQLNAI